MERNNYETTFNSLKTDMQLLANYLLTISKYFRPLCQKVNSMRVTIKT